MLRIIAGKYRSQVLKQPSKNTTRPTIDRVREAIFSSIQFSIKDKIFLDLFSGSGSFCLEALSRGAKKAICVEQDYNAYKIILENKNKLGEENLDTFNITAQKFLEQNREEKFDYIYLDPPFIDKKLLLWCLDTIFQRQLLNYGGLVIVETDANDFLFNSGTYNIIKNKKYGKIFVYYITYAQFK
ncbi:16S rRNA (guanine(966)-N(2))-methyltransferase RsmD [Mycoplasma phocoeninasale]|uniref:16S rRNA (Guanine(966)-N(2))-methyltransferase RsmD n=1 Tax=Mycoplasma phocoeninasale TaxID=2726117 RepID=A0A858U525_9MOLU|nr:16S rRNA (guanine(966)-N(2))-methyltransferase RsmD [Mycoplasma phocoeninasale]QJG66355.1 16S rRNA (guanine(966)-N(2))-methyltransferase RsmD [Mycoplasma phocoeninasale]